MDVRFEPVEFDEIRESVQQHLVEMPAVIDSFLEEYILASCHYRIDVEGEAAGFASIHGTSLITQFWLAEPFRRHGQAAFWRLRRMEQVQSAFVPTFDEFFLAHALDDYQQLNRQGYFFATRRDAPKPVGLERYSLRLAELGEAAFIQQEAGDLFDDVEARIEARQIFITLRADEPVGFGIRQPSTFYDDVASVGMHTIEQFRRDGVGTATIALLIDECRRRGVRPVAGCWYYNHASKKTLERAGMYSSTRLLKIDY